MTHLWFPDIPLNGRLSYGRALALFFSLWEFLFDMLGASHPRLGDSCWRVLIGSWARPAGGCGPRLARVLGRLERVPLRVEGRGPVNISERDSRAVPNPRGRQVNVEPHNAVSCLRLFFAAHTSCVCASWRLLPGSLTRLPSARTGRPPQRGRPACVAAWMWGHFPRGQRILADASSAESCSPRLYSRRARLTRSDARPSGLLRF